MKGNRAISGDNWTFDGKILTVHIPMAWKRRGGRKAIIAPDGSDAWAPAKPRHDETLIRALARAHRRKRMLDEGEFASISESNLAYRTHTSSSVGLCGGPSEILRSTMGPLLKGATA